ncbi:hypothetical protein GEOBRER4_n1761 [Citrifermentans bremense]|uniref:Uncharacterized protein n=1 Tax=Citrifermentans bremense TaxID=60035 RepID=A0A7R7FTE2_9BACT|nr:hypothetical protein GEOBRER4_n1761 [Citrifermentans bremense]
MTISIFAVQQGAGREKTVLPQAKDAYLLQLLSVQAIVSSNTVAF